MAAADPWIVAPGERAKHEEQFRALAGGTGMVSGDAAKKFFLQSRLPPQVLGVIWSLADINGDGKLDLFEFSIACKLINLKIRGVNLPPSLPPQLKQTACGAPTAAAAASSQQMLGGLMTGPIPGVSLMQSMMQPAPAISMGMAMSAAPITPMPTMAAGVPTMPAMPAGVPAMPAGAQMMPGVMAAGPAAVPAVAPAGAATITRTASQESGDSVGSEWGVPQASKLKFTQVFNAIDRNKSGFLSGVQARNILVQSKLPNPVLAQIWGLSDVDGDGQLSCEEFVLALYLCEQTKAGAPLPPVLPPRLVPPTQRRASIASLGSGGPGTGGAAGTPTEDFEDKRRENYSKGQAELERRRKALLEAQRRETEERLRREREEEAKKEKARAEAEKKRQEELRQEMLRQQEQQEMREQELKRQEELKEQARKDAEKQRQQEWEKQRLQELMNVRQRQQESLMALKAQNQSLAIELQTKDDRIKELTGKISETRCSVTEVKATIDNMRSTRDTHMQDMNSLKAQARDQNHRLLVVNQERAQLKARSAAAAGAAGGGETPAVEAMVDAKKVVIAQLKDKHADLETEVTRKEEDFNNNIIAVRTLKDELKESMDRGKELYARFTSRRNEVLSLREKLVNPDAAWGEDEPEPIYADGGIQPAGAAPAEGEVTVGTQYRGLYEFEARNGDELSFMPGDIITVTLVEGTDPGWLGGELNGKNGWFPEAYCEVIAGSGPQPQQQEQQQPAVAAAAEASPAARVLGPALALFCWTPQHNNQLAFAPGQRVLVREQVSDWMFGECGDLGGWFPSNFVALDSTNPTLPPAMQSPPAPPALPDFLAHDDVSELYISNFAYESTEPGDLNFSSGQSVLVVQKEGDWWTGVCGDQHGVFPSNFVERAPQQGKSGKKPEIATVLAPYDATSSNQLSLQRGQLVMIRKKTASGWWEGELQAKGKKRQVGWFPASYVKALGGGSASARSTPVFQEATNILDAPPAQTPPSNTETKPVTPDTAAPAADKPAAAAPERVEALYPYTAVNPDELTFVAGAVITVMDKEDAAWWKGSLNGNEGVFPSNYVQPYTGGGGDSFAAQVSQIAAAAADFGVDLDDGNLC